MAVLYLLVCVVLDLVLGFVFVQWYFGAGFMKGYKPDVGYRTPQEQMDPDNRTAHAELGLVLALLAAGVLAEIGVGHVTLGLDLSFGNEQLQTVQEKMDILFGGDQSKSKRRRRH